MIEDYDNYAYEIEMESENSLEKDSLTIGDLLNASSVLPDVKNTTKMVKKVVKRINEKRPASEIDVDYTCSIGSNPKTSGQERLMSANGDIKPNPSDISDENADVVNTGLSTALTTEAATDNSCKVDIQDVNLFQTLPSEENASETLPIDEEALKPINKNGKKYVRVDTTCPLCNAKFRSNNGFVRHSRNVHNLSMGARLKRKQCHCMEDGCSESFHRTSTLRKHLVDKHNISMECQTLQFDDMRSFEAWKNVEEIKTLSIFIIRKKNENTKFLKTWLWTCNKSGDYTKPNLIRKVYPSTIKLNRTCTASISMYKKQGKLIVKYYKDHYKHGFSIKDMPLSDYDKAVVIARLLEGFSDSDILRHVKQTYDKNSRLYLLNRKQIDNLKRCFGLSRQNIKKCT